MSLRINDLIIDTPVKDEEAKKVARGGFKPLKLSLCLVGQPQ